ncbi:hypothetical protein HMPREF1546_00367 [Oscillibacter sp. KLE 1745]|nr:hypothetical protein HMPREF1546_00367 [Oscillibacter sp. KLE 1745]
MVRGSHHPPLTGPEHPRYFSPSTPLLMLKLWSKDYHWGYPLSMWEYPKTQLKIS